MTTPDVLRFLSVALHSETESAQRQNSDWRVRRLAERCTPRSGGSSRRPDGESSSSEPPPEAA
jgi:hypothetical protein